MAFLVTWIAPPTATHAQAMSSGCRTYSAQLGAGASGSTDGFDYRHLAGITAYGDLHYKAHLGLEAEYHYLNLYTPVGIAENTLFAGPMYRFNVGRLHPYVKLLGGFATWKYIQGQYYPATTTQHYAATAVGAGAYYNLSHHTAVRAEIEHHDWFTFSPNGLKTYVGTVSVAYRLR